MISKSWSTSKKRAVLYRTAGSLAEFCLQLFPLIVAHSDDYGGFDGDPETVKLVCDPGSPRPVSDFALALEQFETVELVRRYDVAGVPWLQIVKFDEHQPGLLSKRTDRKSPAPPTHTETSGSSGLRELNLTQPNQTKPNSREEEICAELNSAPAFLAFPVVGIGNGRWLLTESQVEKWCALYPGLDVRQEARKALAWVEANQGRRKTARGMSAFLVSWLGRAVDSGRGTHQRGVEPSAPVSAQGQQSAQSMSRAAERIRGTA